MYRGLSRGTTLLEVAKCLHTLIPDQIVIKQRAMCNDLSSCISVVGMHWREDLLGLILFEVDFDQLAALIERTLFQIPSWRLPHRTLTVVFSLIPCATMRPHLS